MTVLDRLSRSAQTLSLLGNRGAVVNASTLAREKERAIAEANLAIAHAREGFCAITIQYLKNAYREDRVCAWSVNRIIDLMYNGLPAKVARDGIDALIESRDPKVRESVLQKLANMIDPKNRLAEQIKLPAYLVHPAGSFT